MSNEVDELKFIRIPVRGNLLGIRDDLAALLNITEKVRTARYRYRDELQQITWVYDRFHGFVLH
jgi:hypothetical protein